MLGYHVSANVYPSVASLVAAKTIPTAANATLSVVNSTAGTTIVGFGSNATIVRGNFTSLIQPNGTSVSACWQKRRVVAHCMRLLPACLLKT
jgi:hypothetical protein